MEAIRVLVADDHAMLRRAIRALLQGEPDIEVVGEAASGEEAVLAVRDLRPDVVLMDLTMPGSGGLEATRAITGTLPGVRVLVLSMHGENEGLLSALHAGASGFLTKAEAPDELMRAIRRVARGEIVLSPAGTRALVRAVARGQTVPAPRARNAWRQPAAAG
jgi:DNA-binding NarL/FixJ family response regulator